MSSSTSDAAAAALAAQAADRAEQVYMLISFYLEAIIYGISASSVIFQQTISADSTVYLYPPGIYFVLFSGAIYIMLRDRARGGQLSKVFFYSMLSMFAMITTYTSINAYRFVRAYAQNVGPDIPLFYFKDFGRWDNLSYVLIVIVLVLHADALVIYRCYMIWNRRFSVIAVPALLLLFSCFVNAIALLWFINPRLIDHALAIKFFMMIYPVNLAQNCLTTGLIAGRLWRQHRASQRAGLAQAGGLQLLTVARIIVESASVYTVQQLMLLVMHLLQHRAQVILHATMVPSIGIVFTLIAVRTHIARRESHSAWDSRARRPFVPSYLRQDTPPPSPPLSPEDMKFDCPKGLSMMDLLQRLPKNGNTAKSDSDAESSLCEKKRDDEKLSDGDSSIITFGATLCTSPIPPAYIV